MSCVEGSAAERAEERQRHVDAVELIDVVLAAAAGARAAHAVLRDTARRESASAGRGIPGRPAAALICVLDTPLLIVADSFSIIVAVAVTSTASVTPWMPSVASTVVSCPSWTSACRVTFCMPASTNVSVYLPVAARQAILAVDTGRRDARHGQHVRACFDGDARQHAAAAVGHFADDDSCLLCVGRQCRGYECE